MSTKYPLPDDGWVLLRDIEEITERGRRDVRAIMYELLSVPGMEKVFDTASANGTDRASIEATAAANEDAIRGHLGDGLAIIDQMQDATIMARLKEWSYDLPVVADSLLDIPGVAYDALKELCKDLPMGLDLDPNPDPKALTPNTTA